MKRLILLLLIVGAGWYAYAKYPNRFRPQRAVEAEAPSMPRAPRAMKDEAPGGAAFRCDGRTHCSQMTSCAEATYFLKNCPGTKMDGNHDGIPCEKQWCN